MENDVVFEEKQQDISSLIKTRSTIVIEKAELLASTFGKIHDLGPTNDKNSKGIL